MKNIIKRLFGKNKKIANPNTTDNNSVVQIKKTSDTDLARIKLVEFNSKMNQFLTNPYNYTLQNLCENLSMTHDEIMLKINSDTNLSARYNNIIFSQKTTADELHGMLLNNVPPDYRSDFNSALNDPAFNVVYFYCLMETLTVDYYKLQFFKKLSAKELNELFEIYTSKCLVLKKEIDVHIKHRMDKLKLDNLLNNYGPDEN